MSRKFIKRRGREEWREIITRQESSEVNISEYCRQQNLSEKSFYAWRKRLGLNSEPKADEFVQVTPVQSCPGKILNIRTPGGYQLEVPEGMDGTYVKNIVSVLR